MMSQFAKTIFFVLLFGVVSHSQTAINSGISYHGRLLKSDGSSVVSSAVQLQVQIRSSGNENCLLYSEIQTKDLSTTDGLFSLTLNDGSGVRNDSSGLTVPQVLANQGSKTLPGGACAVGTTYTPASTDGRRLKVYFNDGSFSGWEPFPDEAINYVPLAIESQQIAGYKATNLLRGPASSSITELTAPQLTEFLNIVNGISTQYINSSATASVSIPSYTTASPPTTPVAGSFWFDSTSKQLKFYDGTSTNTVGNTSALPAASITTGTIATARLGSGTANNTTFLRGDNTWATPPSSQWTTSGSDISFSNGNVAIGTATPDMKLTLVNDGGIVASGTFASGNNLTAAGVGSRLIWYPKKAAFRAGYVSASNWDSANLGSYSTAMGADSKATGSVSTALGNGTLASGASSTALGYSSSATGLGATAIGASSIASGDYSIALGKSTTAESYNQTTIGSFNLPVGTETAGSWVASDPLFSVGNGTAGGASRSTAMMILKNGNVGVGTTSPISALDVGTGQVNAQQYYANGPGQNNFYLTGKASGNTVLELRSASGGVGGVVNLYDITGATLKTKLVGAGDSYFTGGNVGIGTTTPVSLLSLGGNKSIAPSSSGTFLNIASATITDNVTAGFGTASEINANVLMPPTLTATNFGTTNTSVSTLKIAGPPSRVVGTTNSNAVGLDIGSSDTNGAIVAYGLRVASPTGASSNFSAVFTGGNVGIGTTAPGSALDVNGSIRLRGSTSGYVELNTPAIVTSHTIKLPASAGTANQTAVNDGSGQLQWTSVPTLNVINRYSGLSSLNGTQSNTLIASAPTGLYRMTVFGKNLTIASSGSGCNMIARYYFSSEPGTYNVGTIATTLSGSLGGISGGTYTFYHADSSFDIRVELQRNPATCVGDDYRYDVVLEVLKQF